MPRSMAANVSVGVTAGRDRHHSISFGEIGGAGLSGGDDRPAPGRLPWGGQQPDLFGFF